MRDKVLLMKDWFDQCEMLPVENRQEFYYHVLRYGLYGEEPASGNPMMDMAVKQITVQIDKMNEGYEQYVEAAKKGGRKKITNDAEIYRLAREGHTGREISNILGINEKTIYSSQGWKDRKKSSLRMESADSEFSF